MMNEVVTQICDVNAAARDYRTCMSHSDVIIRDAMLSSLAFETAKRATGYRHATKVKDVSFNKELTLGAVCLAVDGWYVRCTVCLITGTLKGEIEDERRPSQRPYG